MASDQWLRARRWADFQQRTSHAPTSVYHHRIHGWPYVPIHPFADEPEVLERLGMRPEECLRADAWWGIEGDATLLESSVLGGSISLLFAKATQHQEEWVYLVAQLGSPSVTRDLFEHAMSVFAEEGFPHHPRFRLRWGDPWLKVRAGEL